MCRNIKTLHNFEPPVTADEIQAAALQFVRKLSGFTRPSKANEVSFQRAVNEVAEAATRLLHSLETAAMPRSREEEAAKARGRNHKRFGPRPGQESARVEPAATVRGERAARLRP